MTNDVPIGALIDHNLIPCSKELSLQDYDDLTDSKLIASRYADSQHNRFIDAERWLDKYARSLMEFGRELRDDVITTKTQTTITSSVAEFPVDSSKAMDNAQGNAMIDTLDALKTDQPAIFSLDRESRNGQRFQTASTKYDSKGNLHIAVFNFELVSRIDRSSFLFWSWKDESVKIIQQKAIFKLNRADFDSQRTRMRALISKITAQRFALRKTRQ